MYEPYKKLSVILDEYSDDEAGNAVLDEVIGDINLQYQMHRYQIIGDVMRHELPDHIDPGLCRQVMAEVEKIDSSDKLSANASVFFRGSGFFSSWPTLRPFAGMAVAASVALISVSIWQTALVSPEQGTGIDAVISSVQQQKIKTLASQPVLGNTFTVSTGLDRGMRWTVIQDVPNLQQKLNAYLVNHTEYSVPVQGLIPHVRVAGYDSQ
ncbi:MAG: sigma-E factor negative regulatory protein [Gammaproteobacteria bacterium]|nr:sigma-E factor negative regulatory protein [Gammaproteobacteria bacterium]